MANPVEWNVLPESTRLSLKQILRAVRAEVHDLWFDLKMVGFDVCAGRVSIPLATAKDRSPLKILSISGVLELDYTDTERVGYYDVNRLKLNQTRSQLLLECNIPLVLAMKVRPEFTIRVDPAPKLYPPKKQ